MNPRQRMPGIEEGQVYTYPAKRWRKKRRQYLMNFLQPKRKEIGDMDNADSHTICPTETPIALNEDSKDSVGGSSSKDESIPKVIPISHHHIVLKQYCFSIPLFCEVCGS